MLSPHRGDLVEEDDAAVTTLEDARLVEGPRERPAHRAEELALEVILRNGRAIEDLVGAAGAGGRLAQRLGDDFLADARLRLHQDGAESRAPERANLGPEAPDRCGSAGEPEGGRDVDRRINHAVVCRHQCRRHARSLATAKVASQPSGRILDDGMIVSS